MSDLLGIIAPLKKFLSNTDEKIKVPFSKDDDNGLELLKGRKYLIPDFQREIRWDRDNIAQLIDDIFTGPKYLGNIILTKTSNKEFLLIDGQQRITILTMILSCIRMMHPDRTDTISPCSLDIQSFKEFHTLLSNDFPDVNTLDSAVYESDKLHQINKYYSLWEFIKTYPRITNKRSAQQFVENLEKSNVNLILNVSDDPKDGIRYFIDVNLKGKQLDVEDIFKSHLFRRDSGPDIRDAWYEFKTYVSKIEQSSKINYPLLKILEHYFYCDLYTDDKYRGLVFGEDFLLEKEYRSHDNPDEVFRTNTHLIEIIDSKKYLLNSIRNINEILKIMLNIVTSDSTTLEFRNLFLSDEKIDDIELKVIHNFISKILKDAKVLPKALIMKYILSAFIDKQKKPKNTYLQIYGVYLLAVLFIIFENKKSKDVLLSVLKAKDENWFDMLLKQVNSYFSVEKITDAKLLTQYKLGKNEDQENYKFRCKSLATIYNFFRITDNIVDIKEGEMNKLNKFITDVDSFSTEHFIISDNEKRQSQVVINGSIQNYVYEDDFYKKYVNNLFNFIFIPQPVNEKLTNFWLPEKLNLLNRYDIDCEYSQMIMSKLSESKISEELIGAAHKDYPYDLTAYLAVKFKEKYIVYTRTVLNEVIDHIKNSNSDKKEP